MENIICALSKYQTVGEPEIYSCATINGNHRGCITIIDGVHYRTFFNHETNETTLKDIPKSWKYRLYSSVNSFDNAHP